jgi:hypothetical protein
MATKVITRVVEAVATTSATVAVLDGTEALSLIASLNEARAAMKAWEAAEKAAKASLMALMGNATVGVIAGQDRITVAEITREGVDTNALREAFPEAYAVVRTATTYTRLTTK